METRRHFLKKAGGTAIALIAVSGVAGAVVKSTQKAKAAPSVDVKEYKWTDGWTGHHWGFVVDTTKCIGCGRCVNACKLENNVPKDPEYTRTWIERYVVTSDEQVFVDSPNAGQDGFQGAPANAKYKNVSIDKTFFVPKLCNHCENPPCVQVCPVGATYKTKDGVVLIDQERCIGCRYCIQACPYGARYLDPRKKVTDKCTWCYHRISKNLPPACVEACPVGARVFGDLNDPNSKASQSLKGRRVSVLKPALGTKPKVFYIGLDKEVN